jgi:nicotinamide-nucleotide amidase
MIESGMLAEIIAVGSEMLTPYRQDTNSLFLTAGLNALGVSVGWKTILGDNRSHLTDAVRIALGRADIVMLSGGLGPTEDDLTRECVAEALHVGLHRHADVLESLRQRFAARRMTMTANNVRQADVIDGAVVLNNRNGSAPGQWIDTVFAHATGIVHRKIVILLPGPPNELKAMFDQECVPRLAQVLPPYRMASRMLRMALIPESQVDARCAPIYQQFADVETTILAGSGEIQLHFRSTKATLEEAEARVNQVAELVEHEMGDDVFSSHGEPLEEIVLLMLDMRGLTLSIAESCTGGLLASRLVSVPNASRVFQGGAVAYASEQKTTLCHVPEELIEEYGAVSAPVARSLAEGIRAVTGSSIGVSITGLAGPNAGEGADAGKPVGLVYVGIADGEDTQVKPFQIAGERDKIRLWATQHALEMLRRALD